MSIFAWNALDHASEYAAAKKDRRERGGGHAGRVYKTAATMFEGDQHRDAFTQAWSAALYRWRQQKGDALAEYDWQTRLSADSADLPDKAAEYLQRWTDAIPF